MSSSGGKIQGSSGCGDKKSDGGPCLVMAAPATAESHGHPHGHTSMSIPLPIDLHRSSSSGTNIVTVSSSSVPPNPTAATGLVHLRPMRSFTSGTAVMATATLGQGQGQATGPPGGGSGPPIAGGKYIGVGGSYGTTTVTTGVNSQAPMNSQQNSIISLNRPSVTILPARLGQVAAVTGGSSPGGISTLQFPKGTILQNVRAGTLTTSGGPGQPQSITVTPINTFGTSIRLAAGPVNNGSWIQTGNNPQGTFNPTIIRPATIQVGGRTVRPVDAKILQIPAQHHVAQLQVVDQKGSIFKPQISATPIVRGTLHPHPGGTSSSGAALTLPFTLRASIPTLQRPQTTNSSSGPQVQKVITQPAHGPPIQLVAAPKMAQLQTITTPIPRLNPVCLTISNPANQSANNSTPVVTMSTRPPAGTNLIMTPSLVSNTGSSAGKGYPISSREMNPNPIALDLVNQHGVTVAVASSAPSGVTFSLGSGGTGTIQSGHILKAHGLPSGTSAMQLQVSQGNHHLVQVQGPIGVQPVIGSGTVLTTVNPTSAHSTHNTIANAGTPSYYMDHKNLNVSVLHPHGTMHPIALDKRHIGVSLATNFTSGESKGSQLMSLGTPAMILTSTPQQPVSTTHSLGPLQSHSFTHPVIPVGTTVSGSGTLNHQHLITASASPAPHQVSLFTTPVSSKQIVTQGHGQHPVTITMSGVGGSTYTAHLAQGQNQGSSSAVHSLPAHLIPTKPMVGPMTSLNAASILSATLSMTTNGPVGTNERVPAQSVSGGSATTVANSVSVTTTNVTATTTMTTTTVTGTTSSTAAPAQSPSQSQATKSTLSPRPSILRKREAGSDSHSVPLRAQRNLALNFVGNVGGVHGNSLSSGSGPVVSVPPIASASASAAVAAAATANKENSVNSSVSGSSSMSLGLGPIGGSTNYVTTTNLSILKKEFQPPNEESSWQSCSSNSSSGSTTLSTTSETAEIQMQQLQQLQHQPVSVPEINVVGLGSSSSSSMIGHNAFTSSLNSSGSLRGHEINLNGNPVPKMNMPQNGAMRGGPSVTSSGGGSGPTPRVRTVSANKAQIKDIERLKGKLKDDSVSPRKKPRKQQLTTSDLLESASPEISFYQGKKFKKSEMMDPKMFEGFDKMKDNSLPDASPREHIAYQIKIPHVSLLEMSHVTPRPITNHFFRYSDVKPKEERRPTINDLANQKNVLQKVTGWKLVHLTSQLDQVVNLEVNVVCNFNSLLTRMDAKVGPNCATRDLNRIQELLKGNIQRCKVIRDQLSDSRSQVNKVVVEHKSRVSDVISRFASKRPIKKRER